MSTPLFLEIGCGEDVCTGCRLQNPRNQNCPLKDMNPPRTLEWTDYERFPECLKAETVAKALLLLERTAWGVIDRDKCGEQWQLQTALDNLEKARNL